MPNILSRPLSQVLAGLATVSVVLLSGCANMTTTAPVVTSFSSPANITGKVHGGNQPVYNAVVRLYAAGTGGYGQGSTLLATSLNSDAGGNFSFTKLGTTGGVIASGLPVWQCPTGGDPQIYITAIGGNTQGTGVIGTNNAASALMAALGPCSGVSSSTQVGLNEISTVASVFALAQYINPGTTPGTETMGTSGSAQGTVGLNNAAANIVNMANISAGQTITPPQYNGTGSAAGVTITATVESAKLVTIANILAACINTPASTSSQCADLFASAAPPPNAAVTSQPGATFQPAQDTIQAAYYMAVNPIDAGTFTSCNNGGTTKLGCLFGLASSNAPFQPNLTAAPSDWTIGVTYLSAGNCANGKPFIFGPTKAAVDASGNVWFIDGGTAGDNYGELTPTGTPIFCAGNGPAGRQISIDTSGNVWASYNTSAAGAIQEVPSGTGAPVNWPFTGTAYALGTDGKGNVFYSASAGGGTVYEFVNPGTTTTTFSPIVAATGFNGTTSTLFGYLAPDSNGDIFLSTATNAKLYSMIPGTTPPPAAITALQVTSNVLTVTANNTFSAGQLVDFTGLTAGAALNHVTLTILTADSTSFTAALTTADSPLTSDSGTATIVPTYTQGTITLGQTSYGVAVDSNGFAYTAATCCGSGTPYRTVEKVTPSGTGGSYTSSPAYTGGINGARSTAIDGAGNEWNGYELPVVAGVSPSPDLYGVGETAWTGSGTTAVATGLSPNGNPSTCSTSGCYTGGSFIKSDFEAVWDLQVDPSGNVWVMNTGTGTSVSYSGPSITEIIGAAVPIVTPTSVAAMNGVQATKP